MVFHTTYRVHSPVVVRYPVWQHTFVSPSAYSRRAVVSYWRKYVHEVLVNRLGGLSLPMKSVVRLTDRPDMTLDVYRARKTAMQQMEQLRLSVQPHDKKRNTFFCNKTHHTPAAISHHVNKRSMVFYSTKGDQNLAELKYIPCYNSCCRFQSTNRTVLELLS